MSVAVSPIKTPIRGVNLGGWLVLEKWMTESIFAGTGAIDEYTYCNGSDKTRLKALRTHRDTFITESDFRWIAAQGLTAVRLPVGYWAFGDETPFVGCIDYVDKAFEWAAKYKLDVLLSVHGAPGSQNGQDHSGRVGSIEWHHEQANIERTIAFAADLAKRYCKSPQLWGIELLNEPMPAVPKRKLKPYYQEAYEAIRAECDCRIVFHDGFRPFRYRRIMKTKRYPDTYIDTHQYQVFTDRDRELDIRGHLIKTAKPVQKAIRKMAKHHPVLVGEWSAALDEKSLAGLDKPGRDIAHRAYAAAQLAVYEQTAGWFYWSYKTEQGGPWSFRDCIAKGWLPRFS